jgi:tripartite ATP-independent transporter DctM subunit
MDIGLMSLFYAGMLLALLILGLPIAFCVGGVAILIILFQLGPTSLYLIATSTWEAWTNYVLISIPLFVFMAYLLEGSGMADDLFETMYRWLGSVRGGLAIGVVIICTIFAAMSGMSAVGTITMGLIALPAMMKRGYDQKLAMGAIASGGTLGILIPPSVPMIIYGYLAQESVGKLFMAGVIPGLIMSGIFIAYIWIRCRININMGPPIPKEERGTWKDKFISLRGVILPLVLVFVVLGFIYLGVTTTTEAAGIGALGALIVVLIYRKFSWKLLRNSLMKTLRITVMAGWVILGATLFTHVYSLMGASDFVKEMISTLGVNPWFVIIMMQVILMILGCFMDPTGIMIITIPIFVPLIKALGFDPIWFGILFVINLEMGYLTPPFGYNLFYMRMLVPKSVTMGTIYKAIVPFVAIMLLCLVILMVFPQLALWLPNMMMPMR